MKELLSVSTRELELTESHMMIGVKKLLRWRMNNTIVLSKIILAMNHPIRPLELKTVFRLIMLRLLLHVNFQVNFISLLSITLIFSDSNSSRCPKHKDFQVMPSIMRMKTKKRFSWFMSRLYMHPKFRSQLRLSQVISLTRLRLMPIQSCTLKLVLYYMETVAA